MGEGGRTTWHVGHVKGASWVGAVEEAQDQQGGRGSDSWEGATAPGADVDVGEVGFEVEVEELGVEVEVVKVGVGPVLVARRGGARPVGGATRARRRRKGEGEGGGAGVGEARRGTRGPRRRAARARCRLA